MPRGHGTSLYPPSAGIEADLTNVFLAYEQALLRHQPVNYGQCDDYRLFRKVFTHFRLAHIWRGRGTDKEIMTVSVCARVARGRMCVQLTDNLFTMVMTHMQYDEDCASVKDGWSAVSGRQMACIYLLQAFYALQPANMHMHVSCLIT
jgi:hypothetical protein